MAARCAKTRMFSEQGQSLVLALIILLVLVISAGTVAALVTSNQNTSSNERQGVHALAAADAGLDLAANKVSSGDATCTVSSPCSPSSGVDGASVQYWATASGSSYVLTARATSPNGKVQRLLQETIQSNTSSQQGGPSAIWGYGFVMGGAPSSTPYRTNTAVDDYCQSGKPVTIFGGSGAITVPTWINGDFCASGGSNPAIGNPASNSPIPVHIGGTMYDQQGPTCVIGDGSGICSNKGPVTSAEIVGGCWNHHAAAMVPCDGNSQTAVNGGSGVYATTFTPAPGSPTPTKPVLDATTELSIYQSASPGPKNGCTGASTGPPPSNLFDSAGSTVPDTSLGTKGWDQLFGLTHGFDCFGANGGELKWMPCSSPPCYNGSTGTLYISGTVFIDANLTFGSANTDYVKIDPTSNGSLYVDGTIVFSSDSYMGPDGSGWSTPTTIPTFFMSAYNRQNAAYGFELLNNSRFEGVIYTNGGFHLDNSARNAGSVFADYGWVIGAGKFAVTTAIPNGALGGSTSQPTTTWSVAPRSWRECPLSGCS